MRCTVFGTGYLGATHAAGMAELGHEVLGVDIDPGKIACPTLAFLPASDRIVLIEETSEILIDKPNLVRFEARRAQASLGQEDPMPAVTIADLVRATLRHRPDRILVGEVRGPEAFDLLQALMLGVGRVLSREQLEQSLYSWGQEVESNAVEVHIHHLRKKLGAERIQTVRGVGYLLPKAAAPGRSGG